MCVKRVSLDRHYHLLWRRAVGMMRADTIDHLPAVSGDHVEEIGDDAGVLAVPLGRDDERRAHIHHDHLDALALLWAELLKKLAHRRAVSIDSKMVRVDCLGDKQVSLG